MREQHETDTPERTPIVCEATGKLIARMDQYGIYVWCKVCRTEHRITLTGTTTHAANWQAMQHHLLPV